MNDYYRDDSVRVIAGDCLDVLRTLPDNSVDSVVTDPPYGLGFMGKDWDDLPPGQPWAAECLRVLKPGGHMLAFGGTRTSHRLACAVEDAGFEIRDSIAWLYGSGFPKSLDVGKAIDKAAGAAREVVGTADRKASLGVGGILGASRFGEAPSITAPATDAARQWDGWGTALKPGHEPIVVARKPLTGTVAANVLEWGTGALNIDGCRIEHGSDIDLTREQRQSQPTSGMMGLGASGYHSDHVQPLYAPGGRWPANVVLDEAQAQVLDQQSGNRPGAVSNGSKTTDGLTGSDTFKIHAREQAPGYGDQGGASRYFYTAKADASERVRVDGVAHPTVKPLSLMRWLVRLVTPPGGTVLEPFAGSGTTVEACILEGFRVIAIEREPDYLPLIVQRINRRRNPVAAVRADGGDAGLFDLLDGGAA